MPISAGTSARPAPEPREGMRSPRLDEIEFKRRHRNNSPRDAARTLAEAVMEHRATCHRVTGATLTKPGAK